MKNLKAVRINDFVYWVGAIDWSIADFHGYNTNRGATYNAYLILADKITLIDTVKPEFFNEMMSRISSVINPQDISYIISNHTEMDHSGSLGRTIKAVNPEKVFASVMGVKAIAQHHLTDFEITPVKEGELLSLGNISAVFMETRMLHWPDNMFTYLPESKILFSNDAFGMHLASSERFTSEIDPFVLQYEGEKYFANFLLPYSGVVTKLIEKVKASGLEIEMVLPAHGPIWRGHEEVSKVIGYYSSWAEQKHCPKVLVVYDTMWKSTEKMARAIADGVSQSGVSVKLMSMKSAHRSEVALEMLNCGAIVAGSPTLNNNLFPTMADVMTYLKGLRPKNLIGAAFGSYGWSGESIAILENYLKDMKIELAGESVSCQYVPGDDILNKCNELGITIAEKIKTSI